jgi:hypothetical protein
MAEAPKLSVVPGAVLRHVREQRFEVADGPSHWQPDPMLILIEDRDSLSSDLDPTGKGQVGGPCGGSQS